jgi:predicted nucleic acid-binding protein
MRFVLDASIAVKWVLPEPDTPKALSLRHDLQTQVHEFIAPDTFPVEVAHALTRAERRGTIRQQEAIQKLADVLATAPQFFHYLSMLPRAVELSSQLRIGVYDCLYLSLAEGQTCDVVTADQRLKAIGHPRIILLADYQ